MKRASFASTLSDRIVIDAADFKPAPIPSRLGRRPPILQPKI
jgi:hypothetical protein